LANENFQGEFNVMGLSQGSLLARYIVEKCPIKGKVRNYLSIGGPNMGVNEVPGCAKG
jgi:triacylglycerol esterase/lipase EstA (alpha/beta hydrolase family)